MPRDSCSYGFLFDYLFDVTISEAGKKWNLGQEEDDDGDCKRIGRADWPIWSPDGARIAFVASPQSIGHSGFERLDQPWNIYSMRPGDREPVSLMRDISDARTLTGSPNSNWLAFSGRPSDHGTGTWVFSPSKRKLVRVSTIAADWVAWSPSGDQLAVIVNELKGETFEATLTRFHVSLSDAAKDEGGRQSPLATVEDGAGLPP